MPTNDFEKQVQLKMDELTFAPSDEVWTEVQRQISQRRKRRLLIWWWTFPVLLAGGLGIFILNHHSNKHIITSLSSPEPKTTQTNPGNIPASSPGEGVLPAPGTAVTRPGNAASSPVIKPSDTYINNSLTVPNHSARKRPLQTGAGKTSRQINAAGFAAKNGTAAGHPDKPVDGTDNNNTDNSTAAASQITGQKEIMPGSIQQDEESNLRHASVSPAGKNDRSILIPFSPAAGKTATGVVKPHPSKKRMEWAVTARGGWSGIASGPTSLPKSASFFDRSNSNPSYSSPNSAGNSSSGGTFSYISSTPSELKPGASFGLGFSLRRYMTSAFSLEAGIEYNYYSTSMLVGSKGNGLPVSSVPANWYQNYSNAASAVNTNYINQYHFIEIPIRLQQQLGASSPFSLNAGLGISRLVASNALQYNSQGNIYYKDNSLFNKTQWNLSLGMDIRLLRRRPVSFELGPHLQYGLNNLTPVQYYGKRHLLYAGLEARLLLWKK
ncbi:MAG: hypothetical protein JST39_10345 [Bacteroidetes bacterium]|nr:hypothetical protein [Bacteroidota bacterium]